jgi:hypothetical protein
MSEHKIATFGCWNNYKMVDGRIPMQNVTDFLKSKQAEYSDLIILGDNYYPQTKSTVLKDGLKFRKVVFNEEEFTNGFNMVESISIPNKYLIMGNHDLEDTYLDGCIGLKKEMEKKDKFNIIFPFGSKIITVDETKYKYIFIDTNVYNLKKNPDTCFNNVLNDSAAEILKKQHEFIIGELADPSIKTFLIFGHKPLVYLKTKLLDSTQDIIKNNSLLDDDLLKILFDSGRDIVYLCADVHMYQNSIITNKAGKKIKQIVSGTGGADKDYYCLASKVHQEGDYSYELVDFMDPYGYVEMVLGKEGIKHKFIKIGKDLKEFVYSKKYLVDYSKNCKH